MLFKTKYQTIYYEVYGNKPKSILILPGWGNTRTTFTNIINFFKNDYTVYIIDYPGFGNSPLPKKELTIYDYALVIYLFIKENKINCPVIIAHSFGGRITSILLSKYKIKVNKIILMDVAGIKRFKKLRVIIKETIYKILKKASYFLPTLKRELYLNSLLNIFASPDYQEVPSIMRNTFKNIIKEDLRKHYKNITCESLIIWGSQDYDTPLKDAYYLNKVIKDSGLIIYSKANHFSYLQYPILTNNIIKEFINN